MASKPGLCCEPAGRVGGKLAGGSEDEMCRFGPMLENVAPAAAWEEQIFL